MKVKDKLACFSGRAGFYARYRPGYPDSVVAYLKKKAGWAPEAVVADIGAGTGISCELFLRHGNTVFGVEPNADMRAAATVPILDGTAEKTGLPSGAFDFVVAATAFHWFDVAVCRAEFRRILRPGGKVVLLWNLHQAPEHPFVQACEELLTRYGSEGRYCWRAERHKVSMAAGKMLGASRRPRLLENSQRLDLEGLTGWILSWSYAPLPGNERYEAMAAEIRAIFDRFAVGGFVEMKYQTALYWGELA